MVGYRVLRCSAKQREPFIGGRGLFCFEFDIVTFIVTFQNMSWRRFKYGFSVTMLSLPRRLEYVLEDKKLLR